MANQKLKPFHAEIIRLNIIEKWGYGRIAKHYGCSKSAIEWIIKANSNDGKLKKAKQKEITYQKTNPNALRAIEKQKARELAKIAKRNALYKYYTETPNDIVLPIGQVTL